MSLFDSEPPCSTTNGGGFFGPADSDHDVGRGHGRRAGRPLGIGRTDSHAQKPATEDVTVCHPIPSRYADGIDVVVYHVSPHDTETLEEHRSHGDVLLNESLETRRQNCPGNVIHIDRP